MSKKPPKKNRIQAARARLADVERLNENEKQRDAYAQDPERVRRLQRQYYHEDPERARERMRLSYAKHKDALNARRRARYAAKKAARPSKLLNEIDPVHAIDDVYRHTAGNQGARTPDQLKKQEYHRTMGHVADMLYENAKSAAKGTPLARTAERDARDSRVATYIKQGAAPDEGRWLNKRRARALSLAVARDELFIQSFLAAIESIPTVIKAAPPKRTKIAKTRRTLTVLLSDLHIGAALDRREHPYQYGAREEARRFGKVIEEVLAYGHDIVELNVALAGDLMQGDLGHDFRAGNPVAEQFVAALHMLSQALAAWAPRFGRINVGVTGGNHGRRKERHPGRASYQKWDNYEFMLGHALRHSSRKISNIRFDIPRKPWLAIDLAGEKGLVTHGDNLINVAGGAVLPVGQIDKILAEANLSKRFGDAYRVYLIGHLHQAAHLHRAHGEIFINGPLVPADYHAVSAGYYNACGQWLIESREGTPVFASRIVSVGEHEDRTASLERHCKPFTF